MSALSNNFVILTTFHNAEDYISKNVFGTLSQSEQDMGIIFINDNSDDSSEDILFNEIRNTFNGQINQSGDSNVWIGKAGSKDILYIKNLERVDCAALSQKIAVDSYISNTGTICGIVDGDDFLHDLDAVHYVSKRLDGDRLMYSSVQKWNYSDDSPYLYTYSNKILTQSDFKDTVVGSVTYPAYTPPHPRCQGWTFHHFRAFKKILSDNVNTGISFYGPTGLMKPASDVAYFKPMIDMAGADRIYTSKACHYSYTFESPTNDHAYRTEEQARNSMFCSYAISGVNFYNDDTDCEAWSNAQGWDYNYFTGHSVNFSGMKDNKSGFYIWNKDCHNLDGSTTCCTPYNLLTL